MRIFRALKRRSVLSMLPVINAERCNVISILAVCMALLFAVICKIVPGAGTYLENYGIYIAAIAGLSFFEAVLLRITYSRLSNNIYLICMAFILFIMGNKFLELTGSMMLYFAALIFVSAVPAPDLKQFKAVSAAQALIMLVYIIKYMRMPFTVFQIVSVNIMAYMVNIWKYYIVLKQTELAEKSRTGAERPETDVHTGMVNRRGFERKVSMMFSLCGRNKVPVGIILLNTYGTPQNDAVNDSVIKKIADTLKDAAGGSADVIARVGKRKFALFVQNVERYDLIMLAKKVQGSIKLLDLGHASEAGAEEFTVNVGIACARPDKGATFEQLYKKADKSLRMAGEEEKDIIGTEDEDAKDALKCG